MATAEQKTNAVFSGLQGSISAIGTMFGPVGMGVSTLLNGMISLSREIFGWDDAIAKNFKTIQERSQELSNNIKEDIDKAMQPLNKKKNLEDIKEQFESLADKVGEYGQNINQLTDEEKIRYNELVQQITNANGDIIQGYTLQGQAIINNNTALDQTLDKLDQQYEKLMAIAYSRDKIQESVDIYSTARRQVEQYNNTPILDFSSGLPNFNLVDYQTSLIGMPSNAFNYAQNSLIPLFEQLMEASTSDEAASIMNDFIDSLTETQRSTIENYANTYDLFSDVVELINAFDQESGINNRKRAELQQQADQALENVKRNLKNAAIWGDSGKRIKQYFGDNFNEVISNMMESIFENEINSIPYEELNPKDFATEAEKRIVAITDEIIQGFDKDSFSNISQKIAELNNNAELTVAEYQRQKVQIIRDFVQSNQKIKDGILSAWNSDERLNAISILQALFGEQNFVVSQGTIGSYTSKIDQLYNQLYESSVLAATNAKGESAEKNSQLFENVVLKPLKQVYSQGQLQEVYNAIIQSEEQIPYDAVLGWAQNYFNQQAIEDAANEAQNAIIQNFDKLTSIIQKLQNGKDLKQKEKSWLKEYILSEEDLKGLESNEDWLEKILAKSLEVTNDLDQRKTIIEKFFTDLDTYYKMANKDINWTDEQKQQAHQVALQNTKDSLDLTSEALAVYAQQIDQVELSQQQLLALYVKNQQKDYLQGLATNLSKATEQLDKTDESLRTFYLSLLEVSGFGQGQGLDFQYIFDNIEAISNLLADGYEFTTLEQFKQDILNWAPQVEEAVQDVFQNNKKNILNFLEDFQKTGDISYDDKTWIKTLIPGVTSDTLLNKLADQGLLARQVFIEAFTKSNDQDFSNNLLKSFFTDLDTYYSQIDSLGSLLNASQKTQAYTYALQNEKKALGLTTAELKEYAETKGIVYKNDQQMLEIYKQDQDNKHLKELADNLNKNSQELKVTDDNVKEFAKSLNQLTGVNFNPNYIIANIKAISEAFQQGIYDGQKLKQFINNYKPNTELIARTAPVAYQRENELFKNAVGAQTALQSGSSLSTDQAAAIAQLENSNANLARAFSESGTRNSKQYLDVLKQIVDKQNVLAEQARQQALISSQQTLENLKAQRQQLADSLPSATDRKSILDQINEINQQITEQQTKQVELSENGLTIDIEKLKTQSETLDNWESLYQSGFIDQSTFSSKLDEIASKEAKGLNLDGDQVLNYADALQDLAGEADYLADSLEKDRDAALQVAIAGKRLTKGIEDLSKNFEQYQQKLTSDNLEDFASVLEDVREAVGNILNIDGSQLSADFFRSAENLEYMRLAAEGNVEAIDSLRAAAATDIIQNCEVYLNGDQDVINRLNELNNQILEFAGRDIQIGTSVDDANFIAACNQMIADARLTEQQIQAYFNSLGFDPKIEYQQVEQVSGVNSEGTISLGRLIEIPYSMSGTNTTKLMVPRITSMTKVGGGSYSAPITRAPSTSSSGGGGGGGRKGSSPKSSSPKSSTPKTTQPDTSQKDFKEPLQDQKDIYHDINIELSQISRNLERTQKIQERLYGKQLIDNLNKQTQILEAHKTKLKEKQEIQKQDLRDQRRALENLQVTFDAYGNISNYMTILDVKQGEINSKIEEYNKLIQKYNQSTNKDTKEKIADQAEALNKQIEKAEKDYDELKDRINNYDSLREDMEDLIDDIEEEIQKQIEINISKFRMELEIRLEMGEAERDWNKFRREVLEHSDVMKDTGFDKTFKDMTQGLNDILSYFNVHGSKGSLQTLTEQLLNIRAEIEAIDRLGQSAIYGDNKAQAMEDLQKDLDELMNQMEDIESLIDNIDEAYLDTIDDVNDEFDKQIEDYEYIQDLMDHNIDLLSLLYGDRNYDAMEKYYSTIQNNNLKLLDSLKQQREFWKQQWDAAVARGDTNAAKQFEQNYKDTIKKLNEVVQDAAKNIQDKYINAIDKIFDTLDKKISNGYGTDYLSTEWQLMNKNANEYLDTINAAFAVQQTERKYQNAVNETKSVKSQQKLKNLMDEQLQILRNKEKVTQYDVDRAEKLLQIEQLRIALEEAQSAKTSLRLKRDSQGNYSYEYVADAGAMGDAQADIAAAQNDLYNFDKQRYQSNLNDMLSAWKDFQSKYKDIVTDTSLTQQERVERLALLRQQYGQYINDKTYENSIIRNNLMESAFADLAVIYETDVSNYNDMSDQEKDILMNDLIPAWDSGIQQMADKVAGDGGFIPVCEDAFEDISEATKDYKDELDDMAQTAGFDLEEVRSGVDEVAYSFMDLIQNNDELINRMYIEMQAIQSLRTQAQALVNDYKSVCDAAKQAVTAIHNFIQAQKAQAAYAAQQRAEQEAEIQRMITASNNAYSYSGYDNSSNYSGSSSSGSSGGSGSGGSGGSGSGGNSGSGSSNNNNNNTNQLRKRLSGGGGVNLIARLASGGYTGDWGDSSGKLAFLHQKELVLNEQDTKNILDTVSILRAFNSSVNGRLIQRGNVSNGGFSYSSSMAQGGQVVSIEAIFPNVNSKKEIEEALSDLVNKAAQRAMKK